MGFRSTLPGSCMKVENNGPVVNAPLKQTKGEPVEALSCWNIVVAGQRYVAANEVPPLLPRRGTCWNPSSLRSLEMTPSNVQVLKRVSADRRVIGELTSRVKKPLGRHGRTQTRSQAIPQG